MSRASLVSIVTPTYNQASFLRATIESVLAQDYPRIEYRVISDGSTDDTEKILRSYGAGLLWESQSNRGQTATINRGWRLAQGEILAWLNSDDTLLPGAVQLAVAYLTAHPEVDVVYGRTVFTDAKGKLLPVPPAGRPFDYRTFLRSCENPIPQPSSFIRRRVYGRVGPLDESLYYFMDWDYWLRAGLHHAFGYVPDSLSTYRLHEESKTVSGQARAAPELERIYHRYFTAFELPADVTALRREAMANMYFTTAGYFLRGGDPGSARRATFRGVRANPKCILTVSGWHRLLYGAFGRTPAYSLLRHLRS